MSINRSTVVNLLKEGTVEIKFTKVDGSARTLNGTLNEDVTGIEVAGSPAQSDTLSVYDTQIDEYRSFRWSSVNTVNGVSVSGL
jgi:hypothetical protein